MKCIMLQVRLPPSRRRRHWNGASLHAVPWPGQHQENFHVPQGPQEADTLEIDTAQRPSMPKCVIQVNPISNLPVVCSV